MNQMARLEVFVCVFVEDLITVEVNPSTTVQQLISRILADDSSPAIKKAMGRIRDRGCGCGGGGDDYLLLYQGLNLLDHPSVLLHDFGVVDKDEIILSRKGLFHVRVQSYPSTPDSVEILVETLEPVRKVKEKISRQTKLPVSLLHLYYCDNLMGDDDKPLAYYGMFKRTDTVDVDLTDSFRYVIVIAEDRYQLGLPFDHTELLSTYHPSTSFKITVKSPSSVGPALLCVAVKGNDRIEKVKSKICSMVGNDGGPNAFAFILEGLYMLMFNRMELEDGCLTLDECGIKDGDTILLCPNGEFLVTVILVVGDVPPEKKVHAVLVRSSETVGMLRTKIRDLDGIPPEKEIVMRYEEKWLVDDRSCLVEHGIVELPRTRLRKYVCGRVGTNCMVEAVTYG